MASQADQAFGERGSDITPEELEALKRDGKRIGDGVGRAIASRYETDNTLEMLGHLVKHLPVWAEQVTYEQVKADMARVASGQSSALFGGNQPQAVQPSDSSGGGMTVGGDPAAAVIHAVQTQPHIAPHLLNIVTTAQAAMNGGASEAEVQDRVDLALRIISGQERELQLVQGPIGTGFMLRGMVEATNAKNQAEQALANEKDDTHLNSLAQQLKNAQNATRPLPTADQVSKSIVASDVNTLVGLLTSAGRSVRVADIKPAVNVIAGKVDANRLP